jgi:hypothetical protein
VAKSLRLDATSVNGWVAISGEGCYIEDVSRIFNRERKKFFVDERYPGLIGYLNARPTTNSEFGLPIMVDRQLVGVLNLEHRFAHAYDATIGICTAFAEQMGLVVASARRVISEEGLTLALEYVRRRHDILKVSDELHRLAQQTPTGGTKTSLRRASNTLRIAATPDEQSDPPSLRVRSHESLGALLERAIQSVPISLYRVALGPYNPIVEESATVADLELALRDVLENCREAMPAGDRCGIRIGGRRARLGGTNYVELSIEHAVADMPSASLARLLYRAPIRRRARHSRPRLGAFVAGTIIREIGGDIYLFRRPDHGRVRTVVLLPGALFSWSQSDGDFKSAS